MPNYSPVPYLLQGDSYHIQISEINALNACLAVIKFKQLRGFYFEEIPYYHLLLELGDLKIVGDSESGGD